MSSSASPFVSNLMRNLSNPGLASSSYSASRTFSMTVVWSVSPFSSGGRRKEQPSRSSVLMVCMGLGALSSANLLFTKCCVVRVVMWVVMWGKEVGCPPLKMDSISIGGCPEGTSDGRAGDNLVCVRSEDLPGQSGGSWSLC